LILGHLGTPHHRIKLHPLPLFAGLCWCPLCLSQVYSVKRKHTPPRPGYAGRKKPAEAGKSPPLKAAVDRRRLKGGLAGKWSPGYAGPP